jgi:5'-nucleotidase
MSGTVGAAMMGALHRLPAIAVSLGGGTLEFGYSARFVAEFVEELKSRPAMPGVVFSINIPRASEEDITGVAVARMGGMHLRFDYEEVAAGGAERSFQARIGLETEGPEGSDTAAFLQDMITITPLLFDWTAYDVLDELRGWDLSHEVGRR